MRQEKESTVLPASGRPSATGASADLPADNALPRFGTACGSSAIIASRAAVASRRSLDQPGVNGRPSARSPSRPRDDTALTLSLGPSCWQETMRSPHGPLPLGDWSPEKNRSSEQRTLLSDRVSRRRRDSLGQPATSHVSPKSSEKPPARLPRK